MTVSAKGELDKALADGLGRAKQAHADNPLFFALVLKGGTDGALMVDRKKIPPAHIAEAKKRTGGSAVVSGFCHFDKEASELVFRTKKAAAPAWAQAVKKIAQQDANVSIKARFEELTDPNLLALDAESEHPSGGEQEGGEGEAEETTSGAEAFAARAKALEPRMLAFLKGASPHANEVKVAYSQAKVLAGKGDLAKANTFLDAVERLLAAGDGKPTGTQPDAGALRDRVKALLTRLSAVAHVNPEKAKAIQQDLKAALSGPPTEAPAKVDAAEKQLVLLEHPASTPGDADARAKTLEARVLAFLKGSSPHVNDMKLAYSQAKLLARKGDQAGANAQLDTVERLLKAGDGAPTTDTPHPDAGALRDRVKALLARLSGVAHVDPEKAKAIQQDLKTALAGPPGEAAGKLDTAEALLKSMERAAEAAKDIAQSSPVRRASFHKARDQWNQACNLARAQLQKFVQAIVSDPDAQAEPDWEEIAAAANGLPAELGAFNASLGEALTRAGSDETQESEAGLREAKELLQQYRNELATKPLFELTDGDAYGDFKVGTVLTTALDAVAKRLAP